MKLISVKWKMYFWCCRWLVEVDDTDWHHVDNGWIVDTLLSIYYSQPNAPKRPLLEGNQADLEGPHYEDQWWIGARSYVRYAYSYWYSVRFKYLFIFLTNIPGSFIHTISNFRPDTVRNILENGYGSTPTPLFNGLIGLQINLMTITDNNAWLTFDIHLLA